MTNNKTKYITFTQSLLIFTVLTETYQALQVKKANVLKKNFTPTQFSSYRPTAGVVRLVEKK